MKSLAMLKMEKNFVAVVEKGNPRQPYKHYNMKFLISKLDEEVAELSNAILEKEGIEKAKKECTDVSNIVDFIFEKLSQEETTT